VLAISPPFHEEGGKAFSETLYQNSVRDFWHEEVHSFNQQKSKLRKQKFVILAYIHQCITWKYHHAEISQENFVGKKRIK
jgi:hypothetical protein